MVKLDSVSGECEQRGDSFALLVAEAAACNLCPQMCERRAVLSEHNGQLSARVLFIGEAPGRQGGDRTRVPFSGGRCRLGARCRRPLAIREVEAPRSCDGTDRRLQEKWRGILAVLS